MSRTPELRFRISQELYDAFVVISQCKRSPMSPLFREALYQYVERFRESEIPKIQKQTEKKRLNG